MRERFTISKNVLRLTFPFLATVATLASTSCGLDSNWHISREYPQCGAENKDPDKSIPKDHKVLVQIHSRIITPDRIVTLDQGYDPNCASKL